MCVLSPVLHLSLVLSSGQLHGTVMTTVGVQRVRMGGIDGATLYILVKCKLKGKKHTWARDVYVSRAPSFILSLAVSLWWLRGTVVTGCVDMSGWW